VCRIRYMQRIPTTKEAATVPLIDAAGWLGMGRTAAYKLAAEGKFPVRTISAGRKLVVPVADLRTLLGLPLDQNPGEHATAEAGQLPS
jgi:chemotaxis signal transduction protein